MSNRKFGKKPPRNDKRTLKLEKYIDPSIIPPPSADWASDVRIWPVMKNDEVADCTMAGAGHLIEGWTTYETKTTVILPDDVILDAYKSVSGWNGVLNDASDTGCVLLDVLNYWRNVGIGGHKIGAYAKVRISDMKRTRLGVWMFGGLYTGFALPDYTNGIKIDEAPNWMGVPTQDPRTWKKQDNGHCVPIVYYNDKIVKVISWGEVIDVSWQFYGAYCDEAYAILSLDWDTDGKSPSGFSKEVLLEDLKIVSR
jgi:hypothetical protein